jgi:hypothetical protein
MWITLSPRSLLHAACRNEPVCLLLSSLLLGQTGLVLMARDLSHVFSYCTSRPDEMCIYLQSASARVPSST